ncbi:hypothetical protein GCM10009534_14040 [Kribbella sandramycini]
MRESAPYHPERDEADVGAPLEGVRPCAGREQVRNRGRLHSPMQEGEIEPLLPENARTPKPRRSRPLNATHPAEPNRRPEPVGGWGEPYRNTSVCGAGRYSARARLVS